MYIRFSLSRSAALVCLLSTIFWLPTTATAQQSTFDISIQAGSCANCHGTDGRSPNSHIPSLAGKPETVLKKQLLAFKSTPPPAHTTIMDRLISGFSDEDIAALALYFSQIPAQAANQ